MAGARLIFVGQQHLAENRAAAQHEFVLLAIEDVGSGDVGGQQIGRELDALVLRAQDAGEGFRQRRLGHAGDAFEQDMAAGEKGDHELLGDFLHADDDPADLGDDAIAEQAHPGRQVAHAGGRVLVMIDRRGRG